MGGGGASGAPARDDEVGERAPLHVQLRIRDDLMSSLSIDDYMYYRARPICTYLERTAPWRAFELQVRNDCT